MHNRERSDTLNPYIALADVYMNLGVAFVLFALLFMLLGHRGWEDIRYKEEHRRLERSIRATPALSSIVLSPRNDAPGEQRWMFPSGVLFAGDTARLTGKGRRTLAHFADLLRADQSLWWRIRVEAHSRQMPASTTLASERRAFTLTVLRAVEVAMFLKESGLEPYRIVASGRGYQDLAVRATPMSKINDRVDILLIPPSVRSRSGTDPDEAASAHRSPIRHPDLTVAD